MHGALHQVRSFNLTRARLGIPPDSIIRDPALEPEKLSLLDPWRMKRRKLDVVPIVGGITV
jgi:hypothetical protein